MPLSSSICSFFPTLLIDLSCRCSSHPCHSLIDWGRKPLSVQHAFLNRKELNAVIVDPWAYQNIPYKTVYNRTLARSLGSHGASIHKVPLELEIWIDPLDVLRETWTEKGKLMQKEEIYNSPNMSKHSWKCSAPRFPDITDFPWCNNTLVVPIGEMLLQLSEEEDAILGTNLSHTR